MGNEIDGALKPEQAQQVLRENALEVSLAEAEVILVFMFKLAKIALEAQKDNENS